MNNNIWIINNKSTQSVFSIQFSPLVDSYKSPSPIFFLKKLFVQQQQQKKKKKKKKKRFKRLRMRK